MSYIQNSSKIKNNSVYPFATNTLVKTQKDNGLSGFVNNITMPDISSAMPDIDLNISDIEQIQSNFIDIEKLTEIYQTNPKEILNEFDFFDDEDKKQLSSLINNKKDLNAFLTIANHESLNKDDIVAAMQKVDEKSSKGLSGTITRATNVVKKAITDGIPEAIELAKSEKIYYSKQLSNNMDEVRKVRNDFSSEGLVDCADLFVSNEEIKNYAMHFVTKDEIAGKKLYDEDSVLKAIGIMAQSPEDAELFRNNAIELESIKDENGKIRYKGSTIVDVDAKMVEYKDLQPTMMKTAHKSDMNDEFLLGITDNLVQNPEMDYALNAFLDCKDSNGNDLFSARNLYTQSSYMVDKNQETIQKYCNNTLDLTQYPNVSGDDIVAAAGAVTNYPQSKQQVHSVLCSKSQNPNNNSVNSNNKAAKHNILHTIPIQSPQPVQPTQNTSNNNIIEENKDVVLHPQTQKTEKSKTTSQASAASNPINKKEEKTAKQNINNNSHLKNTISQKITQVKTKSKGENEIENKIENRIENEIKNSKEQETQTKQELSQYLYKKYGASGDLIMQKLEKNPAFLSIIEKYGNNKEIIVSLIQNPNSINKITSMSPSITTDQLASFIKLCTSTEKTDTILKLIQNFGPQKALRLAEKASYSDNHKDILGILNQNTLKLENKKEQIENIIDNNLSDSPIHNLKAAS